MIEETSTLASRILARLARMSPAELADLEELAARDRALGERSDVPGQDASPAGDADTKGGG